MKTYFRRILACTLIACMMLGLFTGAVSAQEEEAFPFRDVAESAWYADAVYYVYSNGLMTGVREDAFAPTQPVSRAMLATILYRMAGSPAVASEAAFTDVKSGKWYSQPIAWAQENGIVKGVDANRFAPDASVTREQLATIEYRYAAYAQRDTALSAELDSFADASSVSDWAAEAVRWAVGSRILSGKSDTVLAPKGTATRAEVAAMVMRFNENLADVSDADQDGVPAWIEEYLGSSSEKADSDGDGISDYVEIYEIGSDPAVADAHEDMDDDGLTNLEEVTVYFTNPAKADSDLDGISDYDELFVYATDPLNADSDFDGIPDGEELALGTDPLQADAIAALEQPLRQERFEESLFADNAAVPAVTGHVDAVLNQNVYVSEATQEAVIRQSAVIGKGVQVDMEVSGRLQLSFRLNTDAVAPAVIELTENGWAPVESVAADGVLVANVTHSGTYCAADLAVLLDNLGVDAESYYRAATGEQITISCNTVAVPAGKVLLNDFLVFDEALAGEAQLTGEAQETDLTAFVRQYLMARGISQEDASRFCAENKASVITYSLDATVADSDYDGISDVKDDSPSSNAFSGTLLDGSINASVKYNFDYRWFFKDSTTFNKNLCTASILFSTFMYSGCGFDFGKSMTYDTGSVSSTTSIKTMLAFHGMSHTVDYNLTAATYGDDDLSEVGLGHRTVTYNGQTKQIVAVVIRGTNGTIEEWSSNFDLGNTANFSSYPDWRSKKNHKGFDVAANRILDYLKTYMANYGLDSSDTVFWVTGHSRGGAIANLLSASLINEGRTVFAYTFASPNVTIDTNTSATKYQSIFNVVNEDDFVPCVPMTAWNFGRYGRTATIDMTSSMENEWHSLTGQSWYNQMSLKNLNALVSKLAGICGGWDYVYKYTCSCHGGSDKDLTQSGLTSGNVNKVPARAMQYAKKTSYKWLGMTRYKLCQLPAYFMQILAELTAANGLGNQISAITSYKLADRYEGARNKLVSAATIGGIAHPHFCETYYLISQYTSASLFK